jgi:putative transposase
VIFHAARGSTYTADDFTRLCARLKITQSMGRAGSCFDNAAAESLFWTLEWEVLSRHRFSTRDEAREVVTRWACDFYNKARLHSSCGMKSPIDYENSAIMEATWGVLHGSVGSSLGVAMQRSVAGGSLD